MWNQNAAIFEIYIQVITTIYNAQQTTRVFPTREKSSVWKDLLVHTLITEKKYRRSNRISQNYLEDNFALFITTYIQWLALPPYNKINFKYGNSNQNFCFHISSVIFKMTERSKLYKWQKLVVKCKCCRFYTIICNYKLNKHTSWALMQTKAGKSTKEK